MDKLKNLFHWDEIENDPTLRLLGAGLAATHVFTYFFWNGAGSLRNYLTQPVRVCWSFYQSCDSNVFFNWLFNLQWLDAYFLFYLFLAAATALLFTAKRFARLGCLFLFLLTVLKSLVIIQDYRFMGNYHYMPFWLTMAFLFFPRKKEVCALLIALFYFGAGLLKMNKEWLSGAAMIRPPMISGKLLEWATAFVVLFELCLVFWLFSSKAWKRYAIFAVIIAFHAFSWHIVGFFYPSVMFSILAFVLVNLPKGFQFNFRKASLYPLLIVFLVCQFIPFLAFPRSAITGEGRLLSLNMFDAKSICQTNILLRKGSEIIDLPPLIEGLGVRIGCDPQVYLAQAKAYCRLTKEQEVPIIDISLASKATSANEAEMILNKKDICRNPPTVSWWGGIR